MIFERLEVEGFGCVVRADVALGRGLNVLYGPNDLGKSTLAQALRAVLLLQHKSKEHERFKPWHADLVPTVRLTFVGDDGKHWRVKKTFDYGARGSSVLEWSPDGVHWQVDKKSREVDGELRKMLGWGVGDVGGRSGQRGFPRSFLATALLGEHADVEAVFGRDLGEDADDAGRARLTEALQALAEDPQFKAVLVRAAEKVDEAKTATGKWRSGRDSPMAKIRERIEALQHEIDELGKAAQTSAEVHERLGRLGAAQMENAESLTGAEAKLRELEAARGGGRRWHEAKTRLDEARARWQSIADERARLRELQTAVAELHASAQRTEAEIVDAQASERAAAERVRTTAAAIEAAKRGGSDTGEHEHRVRALELELAEIDNEMRGIAGVLDTIASVQRCEDELAEARTSLVEADGRCESATTIVAERESELATLDGVARWLAVREAATRLAAAERAAIDAAALRAQAARHRDAAARAREVVTGADLPGPEELAELRALERAVERAEAKVSLGLAVRLHLETPMDLHVATDGGPRRAAKQETSFTAERGLSLELGSVGRIDVAVGDETARAEVESLRSQWRETAEPRLARCGVDSIAALERVLAKTEESRREAEREELAAQGAEAKAGALDATAATVLDRRAELEALERELGDGDRDAIAKRAATMDAAALTRARTDVGRALAEARTALQHAEGDRAVAGGRVTHAQERVAAMRAELSAARTRIGGEPAALGQELDARRRDRSAALDEARAALARLQEHAAAAVARATEDHARANETLERATAACRAAIARAQSLRDEVAASTARIEEIGRRSTADDEARAKAALERCEAELAAVPEPARVVSDDELAAATAECETLRARADEIASDLKKTEGMLEQVGGWVIREKEQRTSEALDDARRAETEIMLEYEAWELLRDTLKRVEAVEGKHLGHALAGAVEQRLAALTAGRYARLELDRDLKTAGLRAAGAARAIESLSEGLKEQLATLVRLAIAEHLNTVVVLDDHLAQTDVQRVDYFRALFREVAQRQQIIVLTCRPLDYLSEAELAGAGEELVTAVDLGRTIERAAPTHG